MAEKLKYRTVFISDTHLGSRSSRAKELAAFLKRIKCEKLYLVGDFIDMWRLRQRWYWPQSHNKVIRQVLRLTKKGVDVIFIPGNHDDGARQYKDLEFGGVKIKLEDDHTTADGQRLLITHGDQFDMAIKHAKILSLFGSWAYEWLVTFNVVYNWFRSLFGLKYWSLAKYLKLKVKSACTFISKFEDSLIDEARHKGFDGVVCGHIHKAEIKLGEIDYFNCGDWIEHCSALVEHEDGRLELIDGIAEVNALRERRRERGLTSQGNDGHAHTTATPASTQSLPTSDDEHETKDARRREPVLVGSDS